MALRHWVAAAQGVWSGWPQRPSAAHTPAAHWDAEVQSVPAGRRGAQLPALQKLPERHSPSARQEVPQVPLLQAPARHWTGARQAPLVGVPHFPSLAQVPARQVAARVQLAPAPWRGRQVPLAPSQKSLAAHWASALQPLEQCPAAQAPPRQLEPVRQAAPSGAPQRPSGPHTPEVHWTPEVQGRVGGVPLGAEGWQAWLTLSQ